MNLRGEVEVKIEGVAVRIEGVVVKTGVAEVKTEGIEVVAITTIGEMIDKMILRDF